jgi:hypothetical protein
MRNGKATNEENHPGGVMELAIILYFLFVCFWWSGLQESEVV